MDNWLYDDDHPFAQVELSHVFDQLKVQPGRDTGDSLFEEYLLHNPHGSVLTLKPSRGLAAQKARALEEKLSEYLDSLTEEEKHNLVERTQELEAYQEAQEDPEAARCIPMLKREDIRRKITPFHQ